MLTTIKSQKKFTSYLLGTIAFTASLLAGCAKPHAMGPMAMPVTMMPVTMHSYLNGAEFMAQVDSKHATEIRPQVSSRVVAVLTTDGQDVAAGQSLFQLDTSQQAATVRSLKAASEATMQEPESLKKSIDAQRADLAFSQRQLERYRQLVKDHTVSEADTEQYEDRVRNLEATIASEEVRRKEAMANAIRDTDTLQSAAADLHYYTVRAPFSGTVGTLIAKVGDVVNPTTLLTTLTDNRNLEINVAVSADYRSLVHVGTKMTLYSTDDRLLGESTVSYISPKVDPLTQTFLVKARETNGRSTLAVDEHMKARLIWNQKHAVMVPMPAVFTLDGQPFVYRADSSGGKGAVARMQAVKLGAIIGQEVVIESGLKPGEVLITGGIQKLQDGVPVMELPPEKKVSKTN